MRILISNRGEIAARLARTIQRLGHRAIALELHGTKSSPVMLIADETVYFNPENTTLDETYLSIENILKIAALHKIDAIHPGYGFLSESSEFALAIEKANLIFIGPSSETLKLLGDKVSAKRIAQDLSIPVIEGFDITQDSIGDLNKHEAIVKQASKLGYPLIIKASYGGGGRGMRIVQNEAEFFPSAESASNEALRAFGNGELFVEKYISEAQHIEVQIIGDKNGHCIHLFERDCSLQRKHQKLIEIAPSLNISKKVLEQLYTSSIKIGAATKLSSAATIEFLVDKKNSNFYFIESNPRLQVEHTITEEITGLDIVELQIRSALGEPLPSQENISSSGFSIQLRVCAEEPENNFQPSTGIIEHLSFPEDVRVETSYLPLNEVTTNYDSLLAKIICKANDWPSLLLAAKHALRKITLKGVHSNIGFLLEILNSKPMIDYSVSTTWLEDVTKKTSFHKREEKAANILKSLLELTSTPQSDLNLKSKFPFSQNIRPEEIKVASYLVSIPQLKFRKVLKLSLSKDVFNNSDFILFQFCLDLSHGEHYDLMKEGYFLLISQDFIGNSEEDAEGLNSGEVIAPLPCQIIGVFAENGELVEKGARLLSFESMKTEYTINAPTSGTVTELTAKKGDKLNKGDLFLLIK